MILTYCFNLELNLNLFCIVIILEYPLAVKLGTITKEGKGDVYSYPEDDMVENPNLIKHLSHFGINISALEKVILFLYDLKIIKYNNFIIFNYRLKNLW